MVNTWKDCEDLKLMEGECIHIYHSCPRKTVEQCDGCLLDYGCGCFWYAFPKKVWASGECAIKKTKGLQLVVMRYRDRQIIAYENEENPYWKYPEEWKELDIRVQKLIEEAEDEDS